MSEPDAKPPTGSAAARDVPRTGLRRGARLLSLPLGQAGRATLGAARRLSGVPADQVSADLRQQAAKQLFAVLGELKGGAMKFGQMMSLFEAMLPDDIAGPFRAELARLQDAAPPMPPGRAAAVLKAELGSRWAEQLTGFEPRPSAAASIGQVHRATWAPTGQAVAVKIQYPGADEALAADLKAIQRLAGMMSVLTGGMDVSAVTAELAARIGEESNYLQEADSQRRAHTAFLGDPDFFVPDVLAATPRVLVSEWVDGIKLTRAAAVEAQRDRLGLNYVRFLFAGPKRAGLLHADPHPGNYLVERNGRLAVVDFGLVAQLPDGLPTAMGRLISAARDGDSVAVAQGLRDEGFVTRETDASALLAYLAPFVEPAAVPEFHFTRDWLRGQFQRVGDLRANADVVRSLNIPPWYALIHRVWMGGIAVLAQLDVRAPFGAVLAEYLPGWVPPATRAENATKV